MKIESLSVVVAFALTGCSLNNPAAHPDETGSARTVELIRSGANSTIVSQSFGQVEGSSCKRMLFDRPPSTIDALLSLRMEAAKRGANAVMDATCTQYPSDILSSSCWAWVQCKGLAVRTD